MLDGVSKEVGPYEIEAELGRGAMGVVYRGRHRENGVVRAVKVLTGGSGDYVEDVVRFRREAEALARAGGANVVRVHEAGSAAGSFWYVMDYLPGGSLRERLKRQGRLPWREAASLVAKLARALARCHAVELVHRDVKPENVLFDEDGNPCLSDFGCVRDLTASALTLTGTFLGTPAYMPPEQMRNARVDHRADVYALGVILHEAVTGIRPFTGASWIEICENVEQGRLDLSADLATIPPALEKVIKKALVADPEKRCPSAAALAETLETLEVAAPLVAPAPRLHWLAIGLPVAALLLVVATAALVLMRPPPRPALAVVIESPLADAPVMEGESVKVAGRTFGHPAEVLVNGERAELAADGAFTASLLLKEGASEIVVTARGPGDRSSAARLHVSRKRRQEAPGWFEALPAAARPVLPLPRGLVLGDHPGEYRNEKDGSILVFVPGGGCELGMDESSPPEQPKHHVKVEAFFIGKYELTNEKFAAFVAETHHVTKAESDGESATCAFDKNELGVQQEIVVSTKGATWRTPAGDGVPALPAHPVVQVTWADASKYAAWAGLELPGNDEWEKAASWDPAAGSQRRYAWGETVPAGDTGPLANLGDKSFYKLFGVAGRQDSYDDGYPRTAPVGSLARDLSPSGAFDMTGNVAEWCRETVFNGMLDFHPMRGGAWTAGTLWQLAMRQDVPGDFRSDSLGFRVGLRVRR
jgi:serine/threonine-protein kinase